jgi:hypothetical protein
VVFSPVASVVKISGPSSLQQAPRCPPPRSTSEVLGTARRQLCGFNVSALSPASYIYIYIEPTLDKSINVICENFPNIVFRLLNLQTLHHRVLIPAVWGGGGGSGLSCACNWVLMWLHAFMCLLIVKIFFY